MFPISTRSGRQVMIELPAGVCEHLALAGLDPVEVARVVGTALAEDLSYGPDVTTLATIPVRAHGTAAVVCRAPGVVAGLPVAEAVFAAQSSLISVRRRVSDGDLVTAATTLMTVQGPLQAILTAERTALNLLTHLSGVASLTRLWADAVAGSHAR